jgi:acetyl esterase/lipase
LPETDQTLHLGSTASLPMVQSDMRDQVIQCTTASGKVLKVEDQIHMYTPNYMLDHPLISPVMSYLGGLPPLFVIAGDAEVLRDEIVYM